METEGSSRDIDMDEDDALDLEYDELALGPSKRRRKGSDSCSFSFTPSSLNGESDAAPHCPSICYCNGEGTKVDRLLSNTLRFQFVVPASKIRDCQASNDNSHGRDHSCHRYLPEVQVGHVYEERNSMITIPAAADRDKYKKWMCKNDLYEFRISKYHQTNRSISFLDRLRATQGARTANACTSSQCAET